MTDREPTPVAPIPECSCSAPVRVPFLVVLATCIVVALCAFALASCAPARTWSPATATVALPANAPACAEWAFAEALDVLRPGFPVAIVRGSAAPADGVIRVEWQAPDDYPLTLAWARPITDKRGIVGGVIRINRCAGRLAAHELFHVLGGVPNVQRPGRLMTAVYDRGGFEMSRRERRRLER